MAVTENTDIEGLPENFPYDSNCNLDLNEKPSVGDYGKKNAGGVPTGYKTFGTIFKIRASGSGGSNNQAVDTTDDGILPSSWATDGLLWHRRSRFPEVEYSLNKKNRWRLKDEFRNNIQEWNSDDGVKVTAMEHALRPDYGRLMFYHPPSAQCTAYHAVEGDSEIHRKPKKTFASAESLFANVGPGRRRRQRRRDAMMGVANEENEAGPSAGSDGDDVHIQYHIVEGCKSKRLAKKALEGAYKQNEKPWRRSLRSQGGKAKHYDKDDYQDWEDWYWGDFDEYDYECSGDDTTSLSDAIVDKIDEQLMVPHSCPDLVELEKIAQLQIEAKAKRRHRRRSQRVVGHAGPTCSSCGTTSDVDNPFEHKTKVYYVDEPLLPIDEPVQNPESTADVASTSTANVVATSAPSSRFQWFEMIPLAIEVWKDELDCLSLAEQYGDCYLECAALPRRLTIDISKLVDQELTSLFGREMVKLISTKSLVTILVYDCNYKVMDGRSIASVRVTINGNLNEHVQSLSCDTLNPSNVHTISEIVTAAVKVFSITPYNNFLGNNTIHAALQTIPKPSEGPMMPDVTCYSGNMAADLLLEVNDHIRKLQRQLTGVRGFSENPSSSFYDAKTENDDDYEQFCGICYRELYPLCMDKFLALAQCQHWFCLACWRSYVVEQVSNGRVPLSCPEYRCSAMVDFDTLKSFIPLPLCDQYASMLRDVLMLKTDHKWVWCPNPNCGRIVHYVFRDNSEAWMLTCCCGHAWCPKCYQPPHWPANCKTAEMYMEKLKKNGHHLGLAAAMSEEERNYIRYVRVKKCPHCERPMERSEGCNFMYCLCGESFCWRCMKPWGDLDHSKCKADSFKRIDLVDVVKGQTNIKSEWYLRCLSYRLAREPQRLRILMKKLDESLSGRKQLEYIISRIGVSGSSTKEEESEKVVSIKTFKKNFAQVVSQANYFLEYAHVWIYYGRLVSNRETTPSIWTALDQLKFSLSFLDQALDIKKASKIVDSVNMVTTKLNDLINIVADQKRSHDNSITSD